MRLDQETWHPFVAALVESFPEVQDEPLFGDGLLLHLSVGAFEQLSLAAFDREDIATMQKHFAFVEQAIASADAALLNALHVSYAEGFAWGSPACAECARNHASTFGTVVRRYGTLAGVASDSNRRRITLGCGRRKGRAFLRVAAVVSTLTRSHVGAVCAQSLVCYAASEMLSVDQALQDYRRFILANYSFASERLSSVLLSDWLQANWEVIVEARLHDAGLISGVLDVYGDRGRLQRRKLQGFLAGQGSNLRCTRCARFHFPLVRYFERRVVVQEPPFDFVKGEDAGDGEVVIRFDQTAFTIGEPYDSLVA